MPGHEIVGEVVVKGADVTGFALGQRVGVPWLGHACGYCFYCSYGYEYLCDTTGFTGHTIDGGYAELACAYARYVFLLGGVLSDANTALDDLRSGRMTGAGVPLS